MSGTLRVEETDKTLRAHDTMPSATIRHATSLVAMRNETEYKTGAKEQAPRRARNNTRRRDASTHLRELLTRFATGGRLRKGGTTHQGVERVHHAPGSP